MGEKEREYFESFKKEEISEAELLDGHSKAKNLGRQKENFILLLEMVQSAIKGEFKIPTWAIGMIIGAIVYVISPIDAVPDIIPVAGWADDVGLITALVGGALSGVIYDYKKFRNK